MNGHPEPTTRMRGPLAPYLSLRAQIADQRLGNGGPAVCHALTECLDACLAQMAMPFAGEHLAIVAVGGYGRSELCLYSDVDLMLLHGGALPRRAVETILYPLWDAGLKVGHAVRSVREALAAAAATLATLTALLDARTVAGDATLTADLLDSLGSRLRSNRIALPQPLAAAERERRAREPYQLLEADLKEGRGGLRTLQSLHWERRRRELIGAEPLPAERSEQEARATLLATRNALHSVTGRAFERYVFELRGPVAVWLGVDTTTAGRRLYGAMRSVDALAVRCWGLPLDPLAEPRRRSRVTRLLPARLTGHRSPGAAAGPSPSPLTIAAGVLDRTPDNPALTDEEARLIHSSIASNPAADRAALLRLLAAGRQGWTLFQSLESLGWVARALPEWRHVVAAPQEAAFHLYPVDVHLWRTVIELGAITGPGSNEAWCGDVATELGSLDETLLAALFHDLGKGWPGDHSTVGARAATAVLRRFGFGPVTVARVSNAVRHHLLLPNTAMRRDTEDPVVVGQVADAAGDLRALRTLYLLSIADARATGPSVWNTWKATLVRSLFANAARELERRAGAGGAVRSYDELIDAVAAAAGRPGQNFDRGALAEHLEAMPPGYVDAFSPVELLQHLKAMTPPPRGAEAAIDVYGEEPVTTAIIVAEDRPGLLATISGVFALNNVSVLDGRFYTRADGVALDLFHVQDALGHTLDERRWQRVREQMPAALRGELDLPALLREKAVAYRRLAPDERVEVIADAGPAGASGVIEVHCSDRVGLLHQIAQGLYTLGLDIRLAKIDTRGPQVVDSFYVRDAATGLPPPAAQLLAHARALETKLNGPG